MTNWLSHLSIRTKIVLLAVVLIVITGALYTFLLVDVRRRALIAEVDAKLLSAARLTQSIVGPEFHGRIDGPDSLSQADYSELVAHNNAACRDLGLSYLWSVLVLDTNTIVFTSATSPGKEVTRGDHASFFALHSDPGAFVPALVRGAATYSTFRNEWGEGRMVLIPDRDTRGRTYLVGASVQLTGFDAAVRRVVLGAAAMGGIILIAAAVAAVLLARYLTAPIVALIQAAQRMAAGDEDVHIPLGGSREIVTLGRTFRSMHASVREQMDALRASENNLAITLNSIGDAVIATDQAGRVTRMNRVAETLTGWSREDARGRPLTDVFRIVNAITGKTAVNPVELVLRKGEVVGLANHTVLIALDGTERQIADSGAPIRDGDGRVVGVVLVFRDVTEEYTLRAQLEHGQRMQAIGRLAGGVAHDFNNLLVAIQTNAELLAEQFAGNRDAMEELDDIRHAAERGAELTGQLLGFARKGKLQNVNVDLHHAIEEVTRLLQRSVDPRIEIRHALAAPHAVIEGDPSQWHNALLNLAVNAADAMSTGGVLTFRTSTRVVGEAELARHQPRIEAGTYLCIAVEDAGTGMDAGTRARIFEPFFTTKPQGKGTGLGLAAVFGAVQSHGGAIDVDSTPGEGTVVSILLPPSTQEPEAEPAESSTADAAEASMSGHILVVDDEENVRRVLQRMLERAGYTVTMCADGEEALAWYRQHAGQADLVVLDARMPKLSGAETFARLKDIDPDVAVLAMSGFTDEGVINDLLDRGVRGFVGKPFTRREILEEIARHLRGGARGTAG